MSDSTRNAWGVFRSNRLALTGLIVVVAFVLFCFVGPHLYHSDQAEVRLADANLSPRSGHPLGTTNVGYDVLGRLMQGGQSSLLIGLGAAIMAAMFGALWGAVAGYVGGVIDSLMMRVVDAFLSIPMFFFLLFLSRLAKPSVAMLTLGVAAFSWLGPARLVRAETLSLRTRDFVRAVPMMGGGPSRAVFAHLLPNTVGTIVVNATFQIADAVLAIAALSFLGVGIPPPHPEWGGMLSDGMQFVNNGYWWMIFPPGVAIVTLVVAFNFIGDGLRDVFDVRLRRT